MKRIYHLALLINFVLILSGCVPAAVSISDHSGADSINQTKNSQPSNINQNITRQLLSAPDKSSNHALYPVSRVVDGDTIDVNINGVVERIRLIGINTPEVVDPRKPVECFGIEASNKAKAVLTGQSVSLESDPSQADKDKYGRSLRYVFLADGTNFNHMMIEQGYAYEYTYAVPYKYQQEFKQAQKYAQDNKLGLWQDNVCQTAAVPAVISNTNQNINAGPAGCVIKGNKSSSGKIYHLPGCSSYDSTVITEARGERWFCTEAEAIAAGWRKAKDCL